MKAVCPKNENHKEFSVSAHVVQNWKVDENGDWIETIQDCTDIMHSPDKDDIWQCMICGEEAKVYE